MGLEKKRAASRPSHVLIAEDDPSIRALLADDLRRAGLAVSEAASADEALQLYLSLDQVDLVFTDVQMPGSLDGLGLAARLTALDPTLPLIVTSGAVPQEAVNPAFGFIAKPYRMSNARRLVFSLLGREE